MKKQKKQDKKPEKPITDKKRKLPKKDLEKMDGGFSGEIWGGDPPTQPI
jgi:hypothetical protein